MDDFAAAEVSARRSRGNRVKFYIRPKYNKTKSRLEGRPIYEPREYIQISGSDLRNQPDKPAHDGHRQQYAKEYAAFLANRNQDEASGTILITTNVVTPERAEELRYFKIFTVEQLAEVSDSNLSSMGLHTRKERERARDYLKTAQGMAPVSQLRSELESKEARIAELERRLQLLLEQKAAEGDMEEPKKRGPRKAEAPAAG